MDRRLVLISAFCSIFFCYLSIVFIETYGDALFLSTYPTKWLASLYATNAPIMIIFSFIIAPFIQRSGRSGAVSLALLSACIMVSARLLLKLKWYPFAFILCLLLFAIKSVLLAICSNSVASSFTIREYKKRGHLFTILSSIGMTLGGFSAPLFNYFFGVHNDLLLIAFFCFCLALTLWGLSPHSSGQHITISNRKALKNYPLFKYLLIIVTLSLIAFTLFEYLLNVQLATHYSETAIANFLGLLYGFISCGSLLMQIFISNKLLTDFGIRGILLTTPIVVILCSILVCMHASLALLTFCVIITTLVDYAFDGLGLEIALNVLPQSIRKTASVFRHGISTPIGKLMAAITIALCSHFSLHWIGVITLLLAVIWCYIIFKITIYYNHALKKQVNSKRFITDVREFSNTIALSSKKLAMDALEYNKPHLLRFAFAMLADIPDPIPVEKLTRIVKSAENDIQCLAIERLSEQHALSSLPLLLNKLLQTKDRDLIWSLTEAIYQLQPEFAYEYAKTALQSFDQQRQLSAILIIQKKGTFAEIQQALQILQTSLHNTNPIVRYACARLLTNFTIGDVSDHLSVLIADTDDAVALQALSAIENNKLIALTPLIIAKLQSKKLEEHCIESLINLGAGTLSYLLAAINQANEQMRNSLLRIVASINEHETESTILQFANCKELSIQNAIAKYCMINCNQLTRSEKFYKKVTSILKIELAEAKIIQKILTKCNETWLVTELVSRLQLAKYRLLCWLAVLTQSLEIMQIIPILTADESIASNANIRSMSLELLEHNLPRYNRKQYLAIFESQPQYDPAAPPLDKAEKEYCKFLNQFYGPHKDNNMQDLADKLLVLREVRLFKHLPAETLFAIARETQWYEMAKGEKLFSYGDPTNYFYIIASGKVRFSRQGQFLTTLHKHDFFGEIGLLSDKPRAADADVIEEGLLLSIDGTTFNNLIVDLPDVLRMLVKQVLHYLESDSQRLLHGW